MKIGIRRLGFLAVALWTAAAASEPFVAFESGQSRPLAMSVDGNWLYAVNTPDNHLEIFAISGDGLSHVASAPVGMEPVAVAARANGDVWVVNHLSDSVSILAPGPGGLRVVDTLHTGDEPADIVFAGQDASRAFITAAHRGQNSPYPTGQFEQPGIGRADVWVFDADAPVTSLGGHPDAIVTLFGDKPRAIRSSPDGASVYVSVFHSGNRTTTVNDGVVCNGGSDIGSCALYGVISPGGLPAPNDNAGNSGRAPETGLIVKFDPDAGIDGQWTDELGRNWNRQVRFSLPDLDVFAIDAMAPLPTVSGSWSGVGTVLFDIAVNPASGSIYVSNTDANNRVRFEGAGLFAGLHKPPGEPVSLRGQLHEARITVLDGDTVAPRHLNKHIDYAVSPVPAGIRERSLATPTAMAVDASGQTLYVAAFGSSKIGVLPTQSLEDNSFVPDAADHIRLSGGGPSGIVIDDLRNRLYVLTRFDNTVTVIDLESRSEIQRRALHNPEPASLVEGRPFLYDAQLTSSNGEASCAACHIFADMDDIAWDLGDPDGLVVPNANPFVGVTPDDPIFHPMKGPMTTQSLRGLAEHGPMHWRGDRTATAQGGDPGDEETAFKAFNGAFDSLLGRDEGPLTQSQMQTFTDFVLQLRYPPSPTRRLDDELRADEARGLIAYLRNPGPDRGTSCEGCHVLDPQRGLFGSDGTMSVEGESQEFKVPHLRNLYQKIGMFGMPAVPLIVPGDNEQTGDQVRGYGFLHDGSTDTLARFLDQVVFRDGFNLLFANPELTKRDLEAFLIAFDTGLAPIVGQQVTVTPDTLNEPDVGARRLLLIDQAQRGKADLIASWLAGERRVGAVLINGLFVTDRAAESPLTPQDLQDLVGTATGALTYTAVPPGAGWRMALDRDEDDVRNGDDVCAAVADAAQTDTDADGRGDGCDNCLLVANDTQRDTNGDGFGNACDADLDNNGAVNFADLAMMKAAFLSTGDNLDADLNGNGIVDFGDLAQIRQSFLQAPGPSAY